MDAHNTSRSLELLLEKLENPASIPEKNLKKHRIDYRLISENNRKALIEFHRDCFARGLSVSRITRLMYCMCKLSVWLGKDFDKADKEDIKSIMVRVEKSDYSEWTKYSIKVAIRQFYKWLRKTEEFPEEVKWIKAKIKKNNQKLPEDMLSEDDVKRLIQVADTKLKKAFIATLYETGCRFGEIIFMRVKHIQFDQIEDQDIGRIFLSGKTGGRRIIVVACVPYLKDWLNEHPEKDNPEAFIWRTYKGTRIEHSSICKTLRRLRDKAGVKKAVNPHNFRHSRATYLANHLTEAQMKHYFGWVQGSKMASVYVHMSGRDVDNALLKVYGIENDRKEEKSKLMPKQCPRCKENNPTTNKYCNKCGMILDEETVVKIVQKDMERRKADDVLDKLVENPEFRRLLEGWVKKLS